MKLAFALLFFIAGLILAVVTAMGYSKAKKIEGENVKSKPYTVKIAVVFALFLISQILLILNK